MGQESEVDFLYNNLPDVFDQQRLPTGWTEDWLIVPIDEPDRFDPTTEDLPDPPRDLPDSVRDWTWMRERLPTEIGGDFAGSFLRKWDLQNSPPPPEYLAFYLPFHIYYPDWWGIYLLREGVQILAQFLAEGSGGALSSLDCIEVARIFLFGHEQFHHSVESFSSRLEATNRISMYRSGFTALYHSTYNTDECLEEAMANAHGVRRVREAMKKAKKSVRQRHAADRSLMNYVGKCPPGYRMGFKFVDDEAYDLGRNYLAEQAHRIALPGRRPMQPSIWSAFPRAFQPFRTKTGRVNYLVEKDSEFGQRIRLDGRFYRYREVVRQLKRVAGCELVRSNGSHHIYQTSTNKTVSVPRHPCDIGVGLLHKIIRDAGLKFSILEFMQL